MDKLAKFLLPRLEPRAETFLDRAVREELKRHDLTKAVGASHRTSGTGQVPVDPSKTSVH